MECWVLIYPKLHHSSTPTLQRVYGSQRSHTTRSSRYSQTPTPDVVYIDVRTEREFANGHPAGAVNIPVAFPDPARGMMANPDFVSVVEKNFSKDKKIIVGCQAGPRSTAASRHA